MKQGQLPIYRAITGSYTLQKNNNGDLIQIFKGVSDEELRDNGIFCHNRSDAQSHHLRDYGCERVNGLPVFLNYSEALHWLCERRYELRPAIVEVRIPIESLFDPNKTVELRVRNEFEPTRTQIRAHLRTRGKLSKYRFTGECYVRGYNSEDLREILRRTLRNNETFHRPSDEELTRKYALSLHPME
jgi:hypothetical protein